MILYLFESTYLRTWFGILNSIAISCPALVTSRFLEGRQLTELGGKFYHPMRSLPSG